MLIGKSVEERLPDVLRDPFTKKKDAYTQQKEIDFLSTGV